MSKPSITELQERFAALLGKMHGTPQASEFQTSPQHDGSTHVELNGGAYHLIATERGLELERRTTADPEELLYWLIADTAFWSAVDFELNNRIEGEDCRRQIFARQTELLERVDPNWARRRSAEIEQTLARHPYSDGPGSDRLETA